MVAQGSKLILDLREQPATDGISTLGALQHTAPLHQVATHYTKLQHHTCWQRGQPTASPACIHA